jgi:hypothetical protein
LLFTREVKLLQAVGNHFPTATDGLRNITGIVNADGSDTIYGVTPIVSMSGDQGPIPNEIVAITDALAATTLPTDEMFSVIEGPQYGVVYRGVAFDPVPEPGTIVPLGAALPDSVRYAGAGAPGDAVASRSVYRRSATAFQ